MTNAISKIFDIINEHEGSRVSLIERALGANFDTENRVVIYGAGIIGSELARCLSSEGIQIDFFLDSDPSKKDRVINGITVKHIDDSYKLDNCHVVIAVREKHAEIESSLRLRNPGKKYSVIKIDYGVDLGAAIAEPAYQTRSGLRKLGKDWLSNQLHSHREEIQSAYENLADDKSRSILTTKLASLIDHENIELLGFFIRNFSEPVAKWGEVALPGFFPESVCYFNNELVTIDEEAVLIDIGAYDGCSTDAFIKKCVENSLTRYKSIAFEPDPDNFSVLYEKFSNSPYVECHNYALHSEKNSLKFISSRHCSLKSSANVHPDGDIIVDSLPLDTFNIGNVSIIKADPPGLEIAIEVLKGAKETVEKLRPILIFPGYHSFEAIYRMPNTIEQLFPGLYKIYLRHLSWSIGETHVFAIPLSK